MQEIGYQPDQRASTRMVQSGEPGDRVSSSLLFHLNEVLYHVHVDMSATSIAHSSIHLAGAWKATKLADLFQNGPI